MRLIALVPAALGLALATACGPQNDLDAYRSALPDDRIKVQMKTDSRRAVGDPSGLYEMTADTVTGVNALIEEVLTLLDTATSFDPTWTDGDTTALWGPWEDGGHEFAVWVHQERSTGVYTWGVNERESGEGDDAWETIVAGQTEGSEDDFEGWFAIDFDKIAEIDPSEDVSGAFVSAYDVDGDQVIASAAFDGFQAEGEEPTSALYYYEQVVGGEGLMDLVLVADATGNGDDELIVVRSRWQDDGQGRADALVTGGELGILSATATECWGVDSLLVYEENNYEPYRDGDVADCAFSDAEFSDGEDDGPV